MCVPVETDRPRQVRADLGVGRLSPELVDVLRELEELESPEAERGQVLEHLLEAAGERHERARSVGSSGKVGPPR